MAVDLADLIESLEREVSPPGTDMFPTATDDEWLGHLRDSFWEAKLYGFFTGFTEADGTVRPIATGGADLDRAFQQLIVLFAALRIIRNELKGTSTSFRAKAGPVEFETQNSAQLLRDILADIKYKFSLIIGALGDLSDTATTYVDAVIARTDSIVYGDTYFVR